MSPQIWCDTCGILYDDREQQRDMTRHNMLAMTANIISGERTEDTDQGRQERTIIYDSINVKMWWRCDRDTYLRNRKLAPVTTIGWQAHNKLRAKSEAAAIIKIPRDYIALYSHGSTNSPVAMCLVYRHSSNSASYIVLYSPSSNSSTGATGAIGAI